MDDGNDRGYVPHAMNLLLLLSAMLSALAGVTGVRSSAPQATCSQSADREIARAAVAPASITRPSQTLPSLAAIVPQAVSQFVLKPAAPLFASRRRE